MKKLMIMFVLLLQSACYMADNTTNAEAEENNTKLDASSKIFRTPPDDTNDQINHLTPDFVFNQRSEDPVTSVALPSLNSSTQITLPAKDVAQSVQNGEGQQMEQPFLEFKLQNSTDTSTREVYSTRISLRSVHEPGLPSELFTSRLPLLVPDIQTPSSENVSISAKIGESINSTCGPDDVNKLVVRANAENMSLPDVDWQWKVLWVNQSKDQESDGIQIIETGTSTILLVPTVRPNHAGTYTCGAYDPTNKLWILKIVSLSIVDEPANETRIGLLEKTSNEKDKYEYYSSPPPATSSSSSLLDPTNDPQITMHADYQESPSQPDPALHVTRTTTHPNHTSESKSLPDSLTSQNSTPPYPAVQSSSDNSSIPVTLLPANSSKENSPTQKIIAPVGGSATTTNNTEDLIAEEPLKAEEQQHLNDEEENNASGVAIGVALAIILAAVATTLVLYRHRRNGKKSTYITFGNPSYSRENLPANDYGLDSPLTLSSNGYTVLA